MLITGRVIVETVMTCGVVSHGWIQGIKLGRL